MTERRSDFDLLQRFARNGEQSAFAEVVRRHLDLVFATALRKLEDPGAAQEVGQNVFAVLARKAWQFAPDDSLPAWLHKTALLESKSWLRGELRRRRREQTAAELGTTMKSPDEQPAFNALVPLLDEALLSLREKDRTALLLRFYESQSLRDVGTSLGVGEDAAQKRVHGALEKLARFFQRRGFKTASVAATAAALQHTAVSASSAAAQIVVMSALQSTPPALVGATALLARLASLSKTQAVAVCIAVTAIPAVWQWNKVAEVSRSAKQLQTQIANARSDGEQLSGENERMRQEMVRLDSSIADAIAQKTQDEETAAQVEKLKARVRGLLTEADYHWQEDVPFVRIPKSALSAIEMGVPILPPGTVATPVRELFGLTPQERQSVETALAAHFSEVDRLINERAYETNHSTWSWMDHPKAATNLVFAVPPLGDEIRQSSEQLFKELPAVLGQERWQMVQQSTQEQGQYSLHRILNLDMAQGRQEVSVWIQPGREDGPPMVGFTWNGTGGGAFSTAGVTLDAFLPGSEKLADLGRTRNWDFKTTTFSSEMANRISSWLREEAETRAPNPSKP